MTNIVNSRRKSKNFLPIRNRTALWLTLACAFLAACGHASAPASLQVPRAVFRPPHPGRAFGAAERERLRVALDRAFGRYAYGNVSLCVIDGSGARVYSRGCDRAIVPASAQKLIVAATALQKLGPAYRYHTQFSATEIENGEIKGDLWLIGSGDPILVSNDVRGGVKVLRAHGLERIDGGVSVDASALSGPERNPLWDPADQGYGFSAATSGISLDQDTVEFHIHPAKPGEPARIDLEPPNTVVTFSGSVLTVLAGYASDVTFTPGSRENSFVLTGQLAASGHQSVYYLPLAQIPNYVANVTETMLEGRGIDVMRAPRIGIAPQGLSVLWNHRSPPLDWIDGKMLHESNNHIAEQLLRTLGRAEYGIGNDAHGIAAETAYLRSIGVPIHGLHLVDGSGLAAANRTSALTLAALLFRTPAQEATHELYDLLPRGGIEGTLRDYRFDSARGRVRAKSGHLSGVDALAGYVTTHRHGRVVFAFLLNSAGDQSAADAILARAVDRVADF